MRDPPSTPPRRKKITIHAQYSDDIIGSSAASLVFVHESWTQRIMENYNSRFIRPAGRLRESSEVWQLMFISPTMLLDEKLFQEYLEQSVDLDVVSKAHAIFPDAKVQIGPLINKLRQKWFSRVERWPKALENAEQDDYKVLIIIEIPSEYSVKKGYESNIDAGLPLGSMDMELKNNFRKEHQNQLFHGHDGCVQYEYAQKLRKTAIREIKEEAHIDLSDIADCQQDLWPKWFHSTLSLGMSKHYAFGASLHTFFIPKKGIMSELVNENLKILHSNQPEEYIENVSILNFKRSALDPTASVFTPNVCEQRFEQTSSKKISFPHGIEQTSSKEISSPHGIDHLLLPSMSCEIPQRNIQSMKLKPPLIYPTFQMKPPIVYCPPPQFYVQQPPILSPNHLLPNINNGIKQNYRSNQDNLMNQSYPTAFITLDDLIATKEKAEADTARQRRKGPIKNVSSKPVHHAHMENKHLRPGFSSERSRINQKKMPCSEPSPNIHYINLSDLTSPTSDLFLSDRNSSPSSDTIEKKFMEKKGQRPPGFQSKFAQFKVGTEEYACLGIGCKYVFREWGEAQEHMKRCNSLMPICDIAMPGGIPSEKASLEKAVDYRSRNVY